jgi:hypothetical protein
LRDKRREHFALQDRRLPAMGVKTITGYRGLDAEFYV